MINRVVLIGRLTKDIELKKRTSGVSTVSFTLAVNRNIKKEGQPEADFINCVAWRQQAEFLGSYAHKGNIVGVEGRIATRSYDGQNGKVYVTEVVCDSVQILEKKEQSQQGNSYQPSQSSGGWGMGGITSDDLPFY